MKHFIIVNSDGMIISTGNCPDDQLQYQKAPAGYSLVPIKASLDEHYWKDGELKRFPYKPSKDHKFNFKKEEWEVSLEDVWASVRMKRDLLLKECDWTQLPDVPEETKYKWRMYRQALRDITLRTDPTEIEWPIPPK